MCVCVFIYIYKFLVMVIQFKIYNSSIQKRCILI